MAAAPGEGWAAAGTAAAAARELAEGDFDGGGGGAAEAAVGADEVEAFDAEAAAVAGWLPEPGALAAAEPLVAGVAEAEGTAGGGANAPRAVSSVSMSTGGGVGQENSSGATLQGGALRSSAHCSASTAWA